MAKLVKSVRFDEELLHIFSDYSAFQEKTFGTELSFSRYVNDSVATELEKDSSQWEALMQSRSIIERTSNGSPFIRNFTAEQTETIKKINQQVSSYVQRIQEPEEKQKHISIVEMVRQDMAYDTVLTNLKLTKSAEEHLSFLERRFNCDGDTIINCFLEWASYTENRELLFDEFFK